MTSISPPTSLATFSQPHASSSKLPHVTLAPVQGKEDGLAVAAVQGDGIWTYDLATLRPSSTFTVPPGTIFNTAPISYYPSSRLQSKSQGKQKAEDGPSADRSEDSRAERITVVGVLQGEKVKEEEKGRVLWVWKGEEGVKSSITLDHPHHSIFHVSHHRATIICISTDGHITALDSALQIRPITLPAYLSNVIAAQILSLAGNNVRIAILSEKGELNVVEIDISGPREIHGQIVKSVNLLEDVKNGQICSADISSDGDVNAYLKGRKDTFISRTIKSIGSGDKPPLGPTPLHTLTARPLALPTSGRPISLLAVQQPEPTLLLVSSSGYVTAVLTTSSLASIAPVAETIITHLSVVSSPSPGSFVIALTLSYKGETGARTAVHTVEISLPHNGIGMNLLIGTQEETSKFFTLATQPTKSSSFDTFLSTFADALSKGEALSVFEKYLQKEESSFNSAGKPPASYTMAESQVKSILNAVLASAAKNENELAVSEQEKKIMAVLLKKKWVNDEMYPGGVLSTLISLKDWDNACRAVRTIPTIPSSSIIQLIKASIQTSGNPTLENVLREILATSTPAPDYRIALRSSLPVEDATKVLEVYSKWLNIHVEKRGEALNGWTEIPPGKKGKGPKPKEPTNAPPLQAIIAHASSLLDSHLPLFLSHPPCYDTLESIQSALNPLMALQESYRKLRAPVEAVLTLSRREAKKKEEAEARRETVRANTNANNGQKVKQGAKKETGGMPDEVVGKWRVEQFVF